MSSIIKDIPFKKWTLVKEIDKRDSSIKKKVLITNAQANFLECGVLTVSCGHVWFRTSLIQDVRVVGNKIIIETLNSVYSLKECGSR
jgi:hypothetical protein